MVKWFVAPNHPTPRAPLVSGLVQLRSEHRTEPLLTEHLRWAVAAPFFDGRDDRWLSEFVTDDRLQFMKVRRPGTESNWHQRARAVSGVRDWTDYTRQARHALAVGADGVVTVFPQLAATVAMQKRIQRKDTPLLAWFFNTELTEGARLRSARRNLPAVDRFVVHSSREIGIYSSRLQLPHERFSFVHLQYGGDLAEDPEDREEPFVFATGSGYRDYATFFAAIDKLGYRTLVLPGARSLDGLTVPKSVTVLPQLSKEEIHSHVRRARVNVVPLNLGGANGGLVTMAETFRHGRAVVSTWRPGVEDYILPGVNSLAHAHADPASLAEAIEAVWTDEQLRDRLNAGALEFGSTYCTDEAAGAKLTKMLLDLSAR